jgi:hypothetical protein
LEGPIAIWEKAEPVSTDQLTRLQNVHELLKRWDGSKVTKANLEQALVSLGAGLKQTQTEAFTFDMLEWQVRFEDAIDIADQKHVNKSAGKKGSGISILGLSDTEALVFGYLGSPNSKGIHITRTIDQYYYPSLVDTSWRDIDQVVRRYQSKKSDEQNRKKVSEKANAPRKIKCPWKTKNSKAPKGNGAFHRTYNNNSDFQLGMVDQLWIWIIDDSMYSITLLVLFLNLFHAKTHSETIISCFPQNVGLNKVDDLSLDLLYKIRQHIQKDARPQISSVYHLATLITTFCVGFVEDCYAGEVNNKESFLRMFSSSIGAVVSFILHLYEGQMLTSDPIW